MGVDPRFAYVRLNTEQGGNLTMWREAVVLQVERLRSALTEDQDNHRLDIEAHFALVAIRNGLRLVDELQRTVADASLAAAGAKYAATFPDMKDLRDVLTHLDEYVADSGSLQQNTRRRAATVEYGTTSWRAQTADDVVLVFAPFQVPVIAACDGARDLLDLAVAVWLDGLRRGVDGLGAADSE